MTGLGLVLMTGRTVPVLQPALHIAGIQTTAPLRIIEEPLRGIGDLPKRSNGLPVETALPYRRLCPRLPLDRPIEVVP